jgi:hypothetical protein
MTKNSPTTDKDTAKLLRSMSFNAIHEAISSGFDVVLDNTHCFPTELKPIREEFKDIAELVYIDLGKSLTLEQLIERDNDRDKKVGEKVLTNFYNAYKKLKVPANSSPKVLNVEPVVKDNTLPAAVIFDIDGTLAIMGPRSPYDFSKVDVDTPNEIVIEHYKLWAEQRKAGNVKIFIVSGRSSSCRELTEAWLVKHNIAYDELHMRPAGDSRSDNIIKLEIFNDNFRDLYNVKVVFDDRNKVVKMWRDLGLTCFQVAPGNF